MLDPESVDTAEFEDIVSLMIQEQFHWNKSDEFILYPRPLAGEQNQTEEQAAFVWIHPTDTSRREYLRDERGNVQSINRVEDDGNRLILKAGEIPPSGLGGVARSASWETQTVQRKALPSWYDKRQYDDPWDIPDSIWLTEWVQAELVPPTIDLFGEDIQR